MAAPPPLNNSTHAVRKIQPRPRPLRPQKPLKPLKPLTSHTVPLVDAEVPVLRVRLMGLIIVMALAALVTRLWWLQVLQGAEYRDKAAQSRRQVALHTAPRGLVVDSKGRPLITNGAQFTVFINPMEMPRKRDEKQAILDRLAPLLDLTPDELQDVIKRNQNGPHNPVAVAEDVNQHTMARIAENGMQLPGITVEPEPMRRYPQGKYAAHVLGYIGPITAEEYKDPDIKKRGYRPTDLIGKSGLERKYDELLDGKAGGTEYEVDAKGRRQRSVGEQDTVPGATLKLSLNLDVQKAAENALQGMKGAAVAVDVRNGNVIALASAPQFDPNLMARRPLKPAIYRAQVEPGLFNRAIQSAVPPGSTFKIVTAAAGLSTGAITPNTYKFCNGGIRIGKTFKRCHAYHGSVNLNDALAASCDSYFYAVSLQLGPAKIAEWCHKFGLGSKTGIDTTGDWKGTVPSPEWKRQLAMAIYKKNKKKGSMKPFDPSTATWYDGETASFSIGQGDLQCTPLQMALAYAAIANGGTVWEPHVVSSGLSETGTVLYTVKPKIRSTLGLPQEALQQIQQGLRSTIAGPRGTAHQMSMPQVAIAGKTGSAEAGRKQDKISHGWFACYAPYDKPQIAICVFLEADGHNYHGGANAGPVAKAMLRSYFNIKN